MKLYRLPCKLYESETKHDKYMAEIPLLPGCRAWGDTAAQAVENLQSVAASFIESYIEHNDPLPKKIRAALKPTKAEIMSEILVAV